MAVATAGPSGTAATRRAPLSATAIAPAGSIVTATEPSVSVRRTRAPVAARRSIVERAGWPYGLPAPAETIATRGRTASRKAGVEAVALPWWATLRMSIGGRPRFGEERVDVVLDVAGQQESPSGDLAEEHDRDVVDPAARIGRLARDAAGIRPQDAEPDVVEGDPGARGEDPVRRRARLAEDPVERGVARAGPAHPGLVDPPDAVALEEERQARDMILVGVGQDEDVDPAVPRRQAPVQLDEEPVRIRPAVDEHPPAAPALDEDRVSLADVEDRDPGRAVGAVGGGHPERADRDRQGEGGEPTRDERRPTARRASASGRRRPREAAR